MHTQPRMLLRIGSSEHYPDGEMLFAQTCECRPCTQGISCDQQDEQFLDQSLREIEGGSTNAKGVAKGFAPTIYFEDAIDVSDSYVFNHVANITMPLSP